MADNTTISQINKLNSSLRWVNRILILLFLFVLALSAAGGWGLFLLSTRLIAVENMKVELYTKLDSFGGMIAEIKDSLARHEDIILRLNNRTTNADVLDKLQEYSKSIDDVVNNVHSLLDRNLVTVTSLTEVTTREVYNVANNMTRKVDADLNDIKLEVNHQLEDSKLNVRKTVEKALNEVNEVQFNVANQLGRSLFTFILSNFYSELSADIMTSYVNESVATIRSVMEEATHTIHEEVEKVKVSVEDYVLISNEQFAKENDFVKYQLAGNFF